MAGETQTTPPDGWRRGSVWHNFAVGGAYTVTVSLSDRRGYSVCGEGRDEEAATAAAAEEARKFEGIMGRG